jgi:flagellar hook-associated protein 3 FlgL
VAVDLDQTHTATIGIDGSAISQGGAAADIFAVLDGAMAAALSGDSAALGDALKEVSAAFDRATLVQTRVGTTLSSMDSLRGALTDRRLAAKARISKLEDVDLASAITGMTQADAAYRASLAATSRMTQLSLMDYLK